MLAAERDKQVDQTVAEAEAAAQARDAKREAATKTSDAVQAEQDALEDHQRAQASADAAEKAAERARADAHRVADHDRALSASASELRHHRDRKIHHLNLTDLPRTAAKVPYTVARLPLGLVEDQVVVRYLDDASPARIGYERFLGSIDKMAGRLLDDDGISRRGQALLRKTDFLAKAEELDAKAERRRAQADEDLRASQAQAARPASRPSGRRTKR